MKKQIIELRERGKTYSEIQNILGCSKGTISYYCGEGQKKKSLDRQRKLRNTEKGALLKKLNAALKRKIHDNLKYRQYRIDQTFVYSKEGKEKFIEECLKNPICYWTGIKLNLLDTKSYELDHLIPVSKGGTNDYNNIVLSSKFANRMKHDLLPKEFIDNCKLVVKYNKN